MIQYNIILNVNIPSEMNPPLLYFTTTNKIAEADVVDTVAIFL